MNFYQDYMDPKSQKILFAIANDARISSHLTNTGLFKMTVWVLTTCHTQYREHVVAQWFRHCIANQKVTGSIPDGVTGIFH
jgi:hypothetical protein